MRFFVRFHIPAIFKLVEKVHRKRKNRQKLTFSAVINGGRYKTRTCDLPHVKRMRYQLRQSSITWNKRYNTRSQYKCQAFFTKKSESFQIPIFYAYLANQKTPQTAEFFDLYYLGIT